MRKCNLRRKVERSIANRNSKRLKRANKMKKRLESSKNQKNQLKEVLNSLKGAI